MMIDRKCRACSEIFDGHWDNWPKGVKPMCPRCGSVDNYIFSTDEDLDPEDDYQPLFSEEDDDE